jgi:hypothetical protein
VALYVDGMDALERTDILESTVIATRGDTGLLD